MASGFKKKPINVGSNPARPIYSKISNTTNKSLYISKPLQTIMVITQEKPSLKEKLEFSDLQTCIPAIPTPIASNEPNINAPINYEGLAKHLNYLISNDITTIAVTGCTGHDCSLTLEEKIELLHFIKENFQLNIIVGDGSNSTKKQIEEARIIEGETGILTHLQISPYQNKPSQNGIIQHYTETADAIKGNIIIYSVPGRTSGIGITPETAIELSQIHNIIAIKEASGNYDENLKRTKAILQGTSNFAVLSGDDYKTLELIKAGGHGSISVCANIVPMQILSLVNHALKKDEQSNAYASVINGLLKPLYRVLFSKHPETEEQISDDPNPSPLHYALRRIGFSVGTPRLPLTDITPKLKEQIDKVLYELFPNID